jgi:hypothetical protein
MNKNIPLTFITSFVLLNKAYAGDNKNQYHLFNPTPKHKMRDLKTDRPSQTQTPYTVDAGHFQVEAGIVKYTYDTYEEDGTKLRGHSLNIPPINFKAGLTKNTDIQFVVDNYVKQTASVKSADISETQEGFGDITIRLKQNLWGNDGGKTAFALMPYIKTPTNTNDLGNDDAEWGLIAPLAIDLGNGYGLGLMSQLGYVKDDDGDEGEKDNGYHPVFVNTATLGVKWTESLGSYYEVFTEKGTGTGDRLIVTLDTGLTYALNDNVQLDTGVNIGVTDAAADLEPFAGITCRY